MGNSQVYGLIDWDLTNKANEYIIILGQEKRYAIENYIFEPHFVGLYLVHKNFLTPKDIGLPSCSTYIDVSEEIKKDSKKLQIVIDMVEKELWGNNSNKTNSTLVNGDVLLINEFVCRMQGHAYEEKLKQKWPKLRSVISNNSSDSALKNDILNTVINHFPQYVSQDIVTTFKSFV